MVALLVMWKFEMRSRHGKPVFAINYCDKSINNIRAHEASIKDLLEINVDDQSCLQCKCIVISRNRARKIQIIHFQFKTIIYVGTNIQIIRFEIKNGTLS